MKRVRILLVLSVLAAGCATSIGHHDYAALSAIDFGPQRTVKICSYLDDGITQQDAETLLSSWNNEGAKYGLNIEPVKFEQRSRSGFFYWDIMKDVRSIPLEPPCDRVLFFANRSLGDFAYGIVSLGVGLPEVLGFVDDETLTHGFVYAKINTPAQLLVTPSEATEHEMYHMMGCAQHFDMQRCYHQIKTLKDAAANSEGFYPTFQDRSDTLMTTREQVNAKLQSFGASGLAAAQR